VPIGRVRTNGSIQPQPSTTARTWSTKGARVPLQLLVADPQQRPAGHRQLVGAGVVTPQLRRCRMEGEPIHLHPDPMCRVRDVDPRDHPAPVLDGEDARMRGHAAVAQQRADATLEGRVRPVTLELEQHRS
jgi:hypothetical protein